MDVLHLLDVDLQQFRLHFRVQELRLDYGIDAAVIHEVTRVDTDVHPINEVYAVLIASLLAKKLLGRLRAENSTCRPRCRRQ